MNAIGAACLLLAVSSPWALAAAQGADGAVPSASEVTVAVMPFANISGDAADAWIGLGIAETVRADLQAIERLSVTGVRRDAGPQPSAIWLLTGGYQRLGNRIRITARFVDVASGAVARTVKVDGAVTELFELQDRIVPELARGLALAPSAREPASRALRRDIEPGQLAGSNGEGRLVAPAPEVVIVPPSQPGLSPSRPVLAAPPGGAEPVEAGRASGGVVNPVGLAMAPVVVEGITIDGPPPPVPPAVVARDAQGRVTVRAVRITEGLRLDGQLDENVYRTVPPIGDFVQVEPDEGAPATEATDVWIFFDDDTLYVSARCWDSQPEERWVANEMRRDSTNIVRNENFAIALDTFYDRRNAFIFEINPLGGIYDTHVTNESVPGNTDWNPVWEWKTGRFDGGWTAEMAIPFRSLRYKPGAAQVWGVNIRRVVRWKNEESLVTAMPANTGSVLFQISLGGTLVGLEVPPGSKNLEIKPYAISSLTTDRRADPAVANAADGDVGLDVKYGLTQNLTADFTYNTDFAQVEVDEQQVNLTRFSLFFPEKREFFLEGQGIFVFGGARGRGRGGGGTPILFYSRRIGLQEGRAVPIEAGGRLTGKIGRTTLGVLNVQVGDDPASGVLATNFSVLRVRQDILRRSSIGALVTRRSVSLDGDGSNEAYGLDAAFGFYDNLNINAYVAKAQTPGLSGDDTSYRTAVDHNADRYGVRLERLVVGDNFNPEVGFLRRDDFRRNSGSVRFSPRPRSIAAVRRFSWETSYDYLTDGEGRLETRDVGGQFSIEFENSDRLNSSYTRSYEFLDRPFRIAPGLTIPIGGYRFQSGEVSWSLGNQRKVSGSLSVGHGSFFSGERTTVGYDRGRIELTPQFSVEPSVSINWIDLPEGMFTTKLASSRVTYTVTPRMFFSGLLQYNSSNDTLSSNLRLRWEYQAGSELFVVYTDDRDAEMRGFPRLENRAFVVKINRLLRF